MEQFEIEVKLANLDERVEALEVQNRTVRKDILRAHRELALVLVRLSLMAGALGLPKEDLQFLENRATRYRSLIRKSRAPLGVVDKFVQEARDLYSTRESQGPDRA